MGLFDIFKKDVDIVNTQKQFVVNDYSTIMNLTTDNKYNVKEFAGWLFATIKLITNTFPTIPIYPAKETPEGNIPIEKTHWLGYLLSNPNTELDYGFDTIMSLALEYYYRKGNAYIWTRLDNNGKLPYALYVIPPNLVTTDIVNNRINGYTFNNGGDVISIPKTEMIHIRNLSADTLQSATIKGLPNELNAAYEAYLTEREGLHFNRQTMQRDGATPYVVTTDQELELEQQKTFLEMLKENVPDIFKPKMLLDAGKKLQLLTTGNTITSATNQELIKQIATCFGVNYSFLLGELMNKDTGRQLRLHFYDTVIKPKVRLFADAFTRHFAQFEDNIIFSYDSYIENDEEFMLRQNESDLNYGIKTVNEIRLERGLSEIEGGDVRLIKQGFQLYDDVINGVTIAPVFEPQPVKMLKKKYDLNEQTKTAYWNEIDKQNATASRELTGIIANVFDELYSDILANNNLQKAISTESGIKIFDLKKWSSILAERTKGWTSKFVDTVFQKALKDVQSDKTLSDYEKEIAKQSIGTTTHITDSLGTIEKEMKAGIQKIVTANPTASKTELLDLFSEQLNYKFKDVLTESRARMIAQTTSNYTNSSGQLSVWSGEKVKYVWLTQRDGDVRPTHEAVDSLPPDKNGYFTVGSDKMTHPCGGSEAGENVNCRCSLLPKF